MIVIDSSALIAIALKEPEGPLYLEVLGHFSETMLAPINYVETGVILVRRGFVPDQHDFDEWLGELTVVVETDADLGSSALAAYLRFGKGLHPARLNLADCFSYALAKTLDVPLLYKGDDFAKTDIRSALHPT